MWSELTYLVEKRCRQTRSSRPQAARAALAVYGALCNCELAFERVEHQGSRADFTDAVLAMDTLLAVLQNIQPLLHAFDPQPAQELAAYAKNPQRSRDGDDAKAAFKRQVELLRRLLALEAAQGELTLPEQTAFTGARLELGRFIRETYTAHDLFVAEHAP